MTTKQPERGAGGKFEHGCGQTFQHAAWYTKHALKCNGKPVQTRGRIDRLNGKKNGHAVESKRADRRPGVTARRSPSEPTEARERVASEIAAVTPLQMLAALRVERAKIDNAIAAIEALG